MLEQKRTNLKIFPIAETEEEILTRWEDSTIHVSILCTAFNHAAYIKDALDGFVSQQTSFGFEVLVHDDASTDDTPRIIQEYQKRFPHIVKPIYQTINQYSQSIEILTKWLLPRASGNYIALCEGDDFWIDVHKLQKQFDALENLPTCDLCFHPAYALYRNGSTTVLNKLKNSKYCFPIEDVIMGGGKFMPTASLFLRRGVLEIYNAFFKIYGHYMVTDFVLQFIGSVKGGALFLPSVDAVYRTMAEGSYSQRLVIDSRFSSKMKRQIIELNEHLDEFSHYQYQQFFKKKIQKTLRKMVTNPEVPARDRFQLFQSHGSYLRSVPWILVQLLTQAKRLKHWVELMLRGKI
jgi:glycosyltransferase involved in cell wall biosynthesis